MDIVRINNMCKIMLKPEKDIKYSFSVKAGDRALIIAPHPDGEVLGCAGIIKKMLKELARVEILLLTDGSGKNHNEEMARIRREEFYKAAALLGDVSIAYLGLPDGGLNENYDKVIASIAQIFQNNIPDVVFVPYVLDYSLDHQVCNFALGTVLMNYSCFSLKKIAMYEVWTPILYPNYYINVTNEFNAKKEAISVYKSQEKYYHLLDKTLMLNAYRAKLSMRTDVKYMECFKVFDVCEYIDIVSFLKCVSN